MSAHVSYIIASFNSAHLLPKVLASIRRQIYCQDNIEILCVDGGSTDTTREIAQQYGARYIYNEKGDPIHAKIIGAQEAKGCYLIYLDHDEVIISDQSLQLKINAMKSHNTVYGVIGSGYHNPPNATGICSYINEFGDPFSFFIYRLSKLEKFFVPTLRERYGVISEDADTILFDFTNGMSPIIELVAGGSMINGHYLRHKLADSPDPKTDLVQLFYLIMQDEGQVVMVKNDPIEHHATVAFSAYLHKIMWRIKNNIFYKDKLGKSGYIGRLNYHGGLLKYKQILYFPYAFLVLPVLIDTIYLVLSRRDIRYTNHLILTYYTTCAIVWHTIRHMTGCRPIQRNYDGTK